MSNRELLSFPLPILNKMGLLVMDNSSQGYVIIPIIVAIISLFIITELTIILFFMEKTVMNYVQNLEGITGLQQILGKVLLCFFIKNKYIKLLKLTNGFWKAEESVLGTQLQDIHRISNNVKLIQKLFFYTAVASISFSTLYTIISKELITGTWPWERNIYYWCTWLLLLIDLMIISYFLTGYDGLFVGFCYEAIIQCKILQFNFESLSVNNINNELDYENYYEKLKNCIKHHILLLRFHSQMQNAYSGTLVFQIVSGAPFICMEAYALMTESFAVVPRYGCSLIFLTIQLAFYCLPVGFLDIEMSLIANSIYNSDWNSKHFPSARTAIVVPMQMAQRKLTLSAYGLIECNANTLVRILRFAFSTSLALKNIKESQN